MDGSGVSGSNEASLSHKWVLCVPENSIFINYGVEKDYVTPKGFEKEPGKGRDQVLPCLGKFSQSWFCLSSSKELQLTACLFFFFS